MILIFQYECYCWLDGWSVEQRQQLDEKQKCNIVQEKLFKKKYEWQLPLFDEERLQAIHIILHLVEGIQWEAADPSYQQFWKSLGPSCQHTECLLDGHIRAAGCVLAILRPVP